MQLCEYKHGPNNQWTSQIVGLFVDEHGGNCCGIQHLHTFPTLANSPPLTKIATLEKRVEWIKAGIAAAIDHYDTADDCDCYDEDGECQGECTSDRSDTWQCAIEVVLTPNQVEEWRESLEACGFKEVFSFHNSNSGNRCHVFFLETNS